MNLTSFSSVVAHWPTDWIILGAFAALVALDVFRSGPRRALALSLASPLAFIAYASISDTVILGSILKQVSFPLEQNLIVAALIVGFFFVLLRIVDSWGGGGGGAIQALIIGIACTAITAVFWLQLAPLQALWHFGPPVENIFGVAYRLWWLIVAYLALAFARS